MKKPKSSEIPDKDNPEWTDGDAPGAVAFTALPAGPQGKLRGRPNPCRGGQKVTPGVILLWDYDVADHLRDEQEVEMYLAACRDEAGDDAAFIARAIADCDRARERWSRRRR